MKKIIAIVMFAALLGAGFWAPPASAELAARSPLLDPTGRPFWYQDTLGLQLAHCIDNNAFCFPEGAPVADPATEAETFYWMAEAFLPEPLNGLLVLALETNAPVAPGGIPTVFARIRIRADITTAGTYTVNHPFGSFTIDAPAGPVGINRTQDVGFIAGQFDLALANDPNQAGTVNADGRSIGPFLRRPGGFTVTDPISGNVYLDNPGALGTVVNGTNGNVFSISGPDGNFSTDQFILVGKLAFCGPANPAPVAVNDTLALTIGQPNIINVLANDTDLSDPANPAGGAVDPATVVIVTQPTNGTAVANADGTVTYTPTPGTFGADAFTYTVEDFCGVLSNVATVSLTGFARAEFRATTGRWTFKGKGGGAAGTVITIRRGSAAGPTIGTATVQADGNWQFSGKPRVSPGPVPRNAHLSSPGPGGLDLLVPFVVR